MDFSLESKSKEKQVARLWKESKELDIDGSTTEYQYHQQAKKIENYFYTSYLSEFSFNTNECTSSK